MKNVEVKEIKGAADTVDVNALRITAKCTNTQFGLDELTLANNVRDKSEYNLPPLIESIKKSGFLGNHPIVVNVTTSGNEVLCGNRRVNALLAMSEEDRKTALVAHDGKIPTVAYHDLDDRTKEMIRCDHSVDEDREPLTAYGLFIAACRLLIAGLSQAECAVRLGLYVTKDNIKKPNRSIVQQYYNLARLPDRIKAAYKAYWQRGEGNYRMGDIAKLYKAWNEEWLTHGINGIEGPVFQATVREIEERQKGEKTTKSLTPTTASDLAKMMTSPAVRKVLAAATSTDSQQLVRLDKELAAREEIFEVVDWLFTHDSKAIQKLFDKARKAIADAKEAKAIEAAKAAAEAAAAAKALQPEVPATTMALPA